MKVIKIIVGGYTQETDVSDGEEDSVQIQFIVVLKERGTVGFIDRKTCIVVIRDGKLVLV